MRLSFVLIAFVALGTAACGEDSPVRDVDAGPEEHDSGDLIAPIPDAGDESDAGDDVDAGFDAGPGDPCLIDHGGCGDPTFSTCTDVDGVATCSDVLECATDNGGCGHPAYATCVENEAAAPTCEDVDACATENGGCGDPDDFVCADVQFAAPTCTSAYAAFFLRCAFTTAGSGTVTCDFDTASGFETDLATNLTFVGGQGTHVDLVPSAADYDAGAGRFEVDVAVMNRLTRAIGSIDGISLDVVDARAIPNRFDDGVKLVVASTTVTAGTGAVEVLNEDGTTDSVAAGLPYYAVNEILAPSGTSAPHGLAFGVPATATSFVVDFFVLAPVAVRLVVNEILVNPGGTILDANGEWFEIFNAGITPVNLRNFSVADSAASGDRPVHRITNDVVVQVGGFAVLGNSTNTTNNGGVPVDYAYGAALQLANSLDVIRLISPGGFVSSTSSCVANLEPCTQTNFVELQRVRYVSPAISAQNGISRELLNPALPNGDLDGSHWADAAVSDVYGEGGRGTPKAQNRAFVP